MNGKRPLQNSDKFLNLKRTRTETYSILGVFEDLSTEVTQKLGWLGGFCSGPKEMLLKVKHYCVQWGK